MTEEKPAPKRGVLESFLRPRSKDKKVGFAEYLDNDIKTASELAEKMSSPAPKKDSSELVQTPISKESVSEEKKNLQPILKPISKPISKPIPTEKETHSSQNKPDNLEDDQDREESQSSSPLPGEQTHPDSYMNMLTDTLTDTLTGRQTVRRVDGQVDRHVDGQVDSQFHRHVDKQVIKQVIKQVNEQVDTYWLSAKQLNILVLLINHRSKILRLDDIVKATDIPYGTVRHSLRILSKQGFITKPKYYRSGEYRGLTYKLNDMKCEQIINIFNKHVIGQVDKHVIGQVDGWAGWQTRCLTGTYSSSSFLKDPTTKDNNLSTKEMLHSHPDLGYWRQKGLTPKQIEQWMKTTGSTLDNMIQSLCHCRYEMVELDQEKSKPVENVFNWFFRVIERAGYYPPPKGYKSYLDRQIELERQQLAEREQKIKELSEIHQQKIAQEKELAFREMMNNQEGELYKACFSRLNRFAQQSTRIELFEMAMRKAFDEIMAERDKEMLESDSGN